MAAVLELYFETQMGGVEKIVVREPGESLTPAEVKAVMEELVTADIFATRSGGLLSPKSARYVERSVQDIEF